MLKTLDSKQLFKMEDSSWLLFLLESRSCFPTLSSSSLSVFKQGFGFLWEIKHQNGWKGVCIHGRLHAAAFALGTAEVTNDTPWERTLQSSQASPPDKSHSYTRLDLSPQDLSSLLSSASVLLGFQVNNPSPGIQVVSKQAETQAVSTC